MSWQHWLIVFFFSSATSFLWLGVNAERKEHPSEDAITFAAGVSFLNLVVVALLIWGQP